MLSRCALAVGLMLAALPAWSADKTDIVVLKNGDRITGEVKGLEQGILTFKTDAMGTLSIEWDKVSRVSTKQLLELENADGQRLYGRLTDLAPAGQLSLHIEDAAAGTMIREIPLASAVHIVPLAEGRLLSRLDGHVSAGLNAASANQTRQYTLSADATLRSELSSWMFNYDGAHDKSEGNESSDRNSLTTQYRRYIGPDWFWALGGGLTSNDELNLQLRTQVGAGFGRYLIRNQKNELSFLIGVFRNHEEFMDSTQSDSYEGLLAGNYTFFHTSDPEVDLSVGLNIYPSFTIHGRVRSDANVAVRYEIIKDLYYELAYIASWDNKPQTADAEKKDWSIVSSIGYKF